MPERAGNTPGRSDAWGRTNSAAIPNLQSLSGPATRLNSEVLWVTSVNPYMRARSCDLHVAGPIGMPKLPPNGDEYSAKDLSRGLVEWQANVVCGNTAMRLGPRWMAGLPALQAAKIQFRCGNCGSRSARRDDGRECVSPPTHCGFARTAPKHSCRGDRSFEIDGFGKISLGMAHECLIGDGTSEVKITRRPAALIRCGLRLHDNHYPELRIRLAELDAQD